MKGIGPYLAVAALLITLGGTLAEIRYLRTEVDVLKQTVATLSLDFQGTRLEIARWMARHEDAPLPSRER